MPMGGPCGDYAASTAWSPRPFGVT